MQSEIPWQARWSWAQNNTTRSQTEVSCNAVRVKLRHIMQQNLMLHSSSFGWRSCSLHKNPCSLDRHSQQHSCIVLLWERPDDSTQIRSVHERTGDELLALGAGGGGGFGEGGGGVRRASGPAFRGTAGTGGGRTEGPGGAIVAGTVTIGTPPAV